MGTETNNNNNNCMSPVDTTASPDTSPEYLAQLLKDKKQIENLAKLFPNPIVFQHTERLLVEEINKVRQALFAMNTGQVGPMKLPEAVGPIVSLSEKMFVPQKEHPEFNFVGRILGPRGMTAKQLEQATGCKIMVRGKGSMRDKKKEEQNRGKPNWEHLNEELHVLITCEDTEDRCKIKLKRACDEIGRLLVPAPEGEDELKRRQLMELAIMKGTYRDTSQSALSRVALGSLPGILPAGVAPRIVPLGFPAAGANIRPAAAAGTAGQPLFIHQAPQPAIRPASSPVVSSALGNVSITNPPPLVSPDSTQAAAAAMAANGSILYPQEMFPLVGLSSPGPVLDYSALDMSAAAGAVKSLRASAPVTVRAHPYQRV